MSVPQSIRDALRSAAACVTGSARGSIQAWVAKTYCHGSPRHTETVFGWNRRGFSLKKVRKTIPQKKIAQTDAIFHYDQ